MGEEVRRQYHDELETVRDRLLQLGDLVTETIPRATEILLTNDLEAAQELIDDDDDVDALSHEVEERCYELLALQQPMATDLRSIVTAIHLTSEMERSADLMVNVVKGTRRICPSGLSGDVPILVEQMGEEAMRLFRLAVDAYAQRNAGLASALDDMDDRLDDLHADYIQAVFTARGSGMEIRTAVQLALVGRYYERVGDHAVNTGNRVRYMVTGWMPEHAGAARATARRAPGPTLLRDDGPSQGPAASSPIVGVAWVPTSDAHT